MKNLKSIFKTSQNDFNIFKNHCLLYGAIVADFRNETQRETYISFKDSKEKFKAGKIEMENGTVTNISIMETVPDYIINLPNNLIK
jgi:hypothetical protein